LDVEMRHALIAIVASACGEKSELSAGTVTTAVSAVIGVKWAVMYA
jgi:hypothetical protein